MPMPHRFGVLALLAGLLTACAQSAPPPTATSMPTLVPPTATTAPSAVDGQAFSFTIEGAATFSFGGTGLFACDDAAGTVQVRGPQRRQQVRITLPAGTEPGDYDVTGPQDDPATPVTVELYTEVTDYSGGISGTVTLEAVPLQPGDRAAGTFAFDVTTAGAPLRVTGRFDYLTPLESEGCDGSASIAE